MEAINPMTGKVIDSRKQILTFGLTDKENNRIIAQAPADCKIIKCESYTDIIAFQGCISFINPDALTDNELSQVISFYSETDESE